MTIKIIEIVGNVKMSYVISRAKSVKMKLKRFPEIIIVLCPASVVGNGFAFGKSRGIFL